MPDQNSELTHFLPYLLNQAAEASSLAFQRTYKDRYGMLRTEWRVRNRNGRSRRTTQHILAASYVNDIVVYLDGVQDGF